MAKKRERGISLKTIIRNNHIHEIDAALREHYGDAYVDMSRDSIYRRIAARTGYCTKVIADVLNHTSYTDISEFTE